MPCRFTSISPCFHGRGKRRSANARLSTITKRPLTPQAGRGRNPPASIEPMSDSLGPRHGGKSEISNRLKIAITACYPVTMIQFILGLGIRMSAFFASAGALFSARNRPCGSVVAAPCCLPQGPCGRGNVLPARSAGDLAQTIDCAGDYRKVRALCGAEIKILPDLREREPLPRSAHAEPFGPLRARCRGPRDPVPRGWSTPRPCACCGPARRGGRGERICGTRSRRRPPRAAGVAAGSPRCPSDRTPCPGRRRAGRCPSVAEVMHDTRAIDNT
jgi:hypothetical protein